MVEVDIGRLHILVVEDEAYTRSILTTALKNLGVGQISSAGNGRRALTILREPQRQVDVILLDLHMPNMNGYEFLKNLRDEILPPVSRTPVIVISGRSEKEALKRIQGMGVSLFLLKPITAEQLATRIKAAVRHRYN